MCSATQLIGFNYAFFYMTQTLPSITPTNATTITTTYMTPTVITPSSTDAGKILVKKMHLVSQPL